MSEKVTSPQKVKKLSYRQRKSQGWMFQRSKKVWVKRQVKLKKVRESRTVIVSFRLRKSEAALLRRDMNNNPSTSVKSIKQFCRKLAIDYAKGRMVYIDAFDRKIDSDARENVDRLPPNCVMSDAHFTRCLRNFLNTEENWRKLRFFMLLGGWPPEMVDRYNEATSNQERLLVAQELLAKMP